MFKKTLFWIFCIFIMFYILPDFYNSMMTGDLRYANKGFELGEDRGDIWSNAVSYFLSNPMGSRYDYYDNFHVMPHNVIVNALIFGGLFGSIAIFYIYIEQFKLIIKIIKDKVSASNFLILVFASAYSVYTLNSMTHNLSLVIGDPTCWILWSAVVSLNKKIE